MAIRTCFSRCAAGFSPPDNSPIHARNQLGIPSACRAHHPRLPLVRRWVLGSERPDGRTIVLMSRALGAVTARPRLALAVMVGCAVAVILPSLLAAGDASSFVLVASAVAAAATSVGLSRRGGAWISVARTLAPQLRTSAEVLVFLTERVTDPTRHPLRPRAPGLV